MRLLTDLVYRGIRGLLWNKFHAHYTVEVSGREYLEGLQEWKKLQGIETKGAILV